MITLDTGTRSLQIVLAGAKTTLDAIFATSWEDNSSQNSPQGSYFGNASQPGSTNGTTNGTTAVTIVPASSGAPGVSRRLKSLQLYNVDTGSITLSIIYNDNATLRKIFTVTLATLENLTYEDGVGFQAFTAAGARK